MHLLLPLLTPCLPLAAPSQTPLEFDAAAAAEGGDSSTARRLTELAGLIADAEARVDASEDLAAAAQAERERLHARQQEMRGVPQVHGGGWRRGGRGERAGWGAARRRVQARGPRPPGGDNPAPAPRTLFPRPGSTQLSRRMGAASAALHALL